MTLGELKAIIQTLNDDRLVTVGFIDDKGHWRIWQVVSANPQNVVGTDWLEIVAMNPNNLPTPNR